MRFARVAASATAAMLFFAAAPLAAQTPQQPQLPDTVQEMVNDFRSLQQQLGTIQQQAIQQAPELQAQQENVQETIDEALVEMDPELESKLERRDSLTTELESAQVEQDTQKLRTLMPEAQQLQAELQAAQAQVMQQESVAAAVQSFQDNLLEQMNEVNPETDQLIERMEELAMQLRSMQSAAGQQQAPAQPQP